MPENSEEEAFTHTVFSSTGEEISKFLISDH